MFILQAPHTAKQVKQYRRTSCPGRTRQRVPISNGAYERPVTETDIASITTSILSGSGVGALEEAEAVMLFELSKHIMKRMSGGCD